MIAAIRLRGHAKMRHEVEDTMQMLGLRRVHTLRFLPHSQVIQGMLKKSEAFITWGEASDDVLESLRTKGTETTFHLKPPAQGFTSLKRPYPKGDLGYRGDKINELIKRML